MDSSSGERAFVPVKPRRIFSTCGKLLHVSVRNTHQATSIPLLGGHKARLRLLQVKQTHKPVLVLLALAQHGHYEAIRHQQAGNIDGVLERLVLALQRAAQLGRTERCRAWIGGHQRVNAALQIVQPPACVLWRTR